MRIVRPARRLLIADLIMAMLAGALSCALLIRLTRWPGWLVLPAAALAAGAVLVLTWVAESVARSASAAEVEAAGEFMDEVFEAEPPGPAQVVIGPVPWEPAAYQPRAALLDRLSQAAASGKPAVVCNLAGTTGVGKSHLAGAYARAKVEDGCPLVIWVSAETQAELVGGLAAAAYRLGVADPGGDSATSADRLCAVLEAAGERALVVFDNASDPDLVQPYLPDGVEVVITTTQRTFDQLGRLVEVGGYERAESILYLLAATGHVSEVGAVGIAAALGDHPLALSQAAATIVARRESFAAYLHQLEATPPVAARAGKPYPRGTAEAVSLAVQAAEQADPGGPTSLVLEVLSVLSTDGVPRALLDPLPVKHSDLTAALSRIVDDNLAGWAGVPGDPAGEVVVMHRLVARVIRERAHHSGELPGVLRAATELILALAGEDGDPGEAGELARLLPEQAASVWDAGRVVWPTLKRSDPTLVEVFAARRAALRHLIEAGDLSGAAAYGADTLADAVRFLGPVSPDTRGLRRILAGASLDRS